MGSGWSDAAALSSSNAANAGERQRCERRTAQKRRRTSSDGHGVADESSAAPLLRRKKRRLSKDGKSTWSSFSFSSAWNSFADSLSCYFARVFLYAAEIAAKSASPGELADEDDLLKGLVQSLDCFQSTDKSMLRRGWRVLCVCSKECDRRSISKLFQQDCTLESDLTTVLTAMERHSERIKIQLLGFRALRTLVMESNERWDALVDARAIPLFVNIMRIHSDDVVIQGLATTFLAMMVREISSRPREQVVNLGGVQLVLDAMRNFDDDPRLLHTACYALHQFGFSRRIRDIFAGNDGMSLLLDAIKSHIDDSDLVDLCLSALGKYSDEANLDWASIMPLVLRTMKRWPREQSIQGHALVLLIRATGQVRNTILIDVAIQLTVRVMKNFPSSANLQFFACAVLREILERVPTVFVRQRVLEEGGMEYIVRSLKNHRESYGLQPMGLLALMNVWDRRTPTEAAAIVAFGGNERAIATITGVQLELINENDI